MRGVLLPVSLGSWSRAGDGADIVMHCREKLENRTPGARGVNPSAGHKSIVRECRKMKNIARDCRENFRNIVRDCLDMFGKIGKMKIWKIEQNCKIVVTDTMTSVGDRDVDRDQCCQARDKFP